MTSDQTKIKTKRTNRTSVFVWVSVFYFPNIGENWCVCFFFVFFSFPGKVHLPFIHSISELFFFFRHRKKKQLFHSFVRICQKTHKNVLIPVNKKIRYLWFKLLFFLNWKLASAACIGFPQCTGLCRAVPVCAAFNEIWEQKINKKIEKK